MKQEATAKDVEQMANYVQSMLSEVNIYSYGEAPEMQVDFHIPCGEDNPLIADTLAAMVPCLSRQHPASAFRAGKYVQLSLHKEPSAELAEAFFHEAIGRITTDSDLAHKVAKQIAKNREADIQRAKERMQRLEKLKKKSPTA
jgi:hypothetical protein